METYLLNWNPNLWEWEDLPNVADKVAEYGSHTQRWSCGNTKKIEEGDRIFLLRQGREPRGIFASGHVTKSPYPDDHWRDDERTSMYVFVQFDAVLNPEIDRILPRERLDAEPFDESHWDIERPGVTIDSSVAEALEEMWKEYSGTTGANGEASGNTSSPFFEGTRRRVWRNRYERNSEARISCTEHYGSSCVVCGFSFEEVYGPEVAGYIHVHHVVPLAERGGQYKVDPIEDLRPVCPNCHAVIHMNNDARSVKEVRDMIGQEHAE